MIPMSRSESINLRIMNYTTQSNNEILFDILLFRVYPNRYILYYTILYFWYNVTIG